jgi:hypothetical protein
MKTVKTSRTFQVEFTLQDISRWSKISEGFDINDFLKKVRGISEIDAKETFLRYSQDVPPAKFWRRMHQLIIDEAIDLHDIVITVVDEDTGKKYHYNPPLEAVFKDLTPKPYLNSI